MNVLSVSGAILIAKYDQTISRECASGMGTNLITMYDQIVSKEYAASTRDKLDCKT